MNYLSSSLGKNLHTDRVLRFFFFIIIERFRFIPLPKKRFAWSRETPERKEKKKITITAITMVKIRGENRDEQRSKVSWHRYKRLDENFYLDRAAVCRRSDRVDPHASAAAISSRPTSAATIRARASFLSSPWTVRQVQVTHFDRRRLRTLAPVAFERFRKESD